MTEYGMALAHIGQSHLDSLSVIDAVVAERLLQDVDRSLESAESIDQLVLGDVERWCTVDVWVSVQSDEAVPSVCVLVLGKRRVSGFVLQLRVLAFEVVDVE
eukprot:CAMPEP_0198135844 /NCGR_PEP_ID=MMETSP1442-20131203/60802_1 /TAXON_ID= /ORGANISM="Craspedostauros australis, Strain CCMP3328" /LENGTH=101 /DNA_ID=CAMNT_0043797033 /DNA_START=1436 /DNA_END=1738 /DNA_ORIENTATION=-